ncbi:MAG: BsuPI-related putative proteinase inhibitor [Blastocatellia bacterium]|nr:BsuPI-related putative proteinase inhibitor [Blastocatellia bacterium]MCS7156671.1 BsuPI-related putative proteinase inhibitor [Blastocatellia bacterium]MCX7751587.1 BsuPI-related putative proteinase inhibitor [Blastocatellia bacterium]MDW8168687.1 BsuPI-related putative proteinase inhibitor [Acidobacteriota bacterium]MDW8255850.1 BsuPI-related putative proteinase inhibitor [Acidobacteriota bacterium]
MFGRAKILMTFAMALALWLGHLKLTPSGRLAASDRIAFEVSADRLEYVYNLMPPLPPTIPGPVVRARIRLVNESAEELRLDFSTSQRFDFLLEDERGRVAFRWSDGKIFLPVLGREIVRPGEALTYEVTFSLPDSTRGILPAGRYTLKGLLTAETPFSGTLPVRIVHAR